MDDNLLSRLNLRSLELCRHADHGLLRIRETNPAGATLLDFAPDGLGTLAGGILLTQICMGDLVKVRVQGAQNEELPLARVQVQTDHPLLACIAGQYAGWPFSYEKYFAMCSGPARIARGQEELLTRYGLETPSAQVVGVLESSQLPGENEVQEFASQCGVAPENVTLCIAPTASLPGATQIVGRSIETTLHKLHELGFDLHHVKSALGSAPLPPIADKDLTALGWTNDSILYGARVQLWVDCEDSEIQTVGPNLPSQSSSDFGRPFQEIFEAYDRDFYKIDKHLFSPACAIINNRRSGKTFQFGQTHSEILKKSFGC